MCLMGNAFLFQEYRGMKPSCSFNSKSEALACFLGEIDENSSPIEQLLQALIRVYESYLVVLQGFLGQFERPQYHRKVH